MNRQQMEVDKDTSENSKKQLTTELFSKREYAIYHPTYDKELDFYQTVSSGDIRKLDAIYDNSKFYIRENGALSKDAVRNARYHLIVSIAMITRFCIESGLSEHSAYGLSDIYIRKADETHSIQGLAKLHKKMVYEFANEMRTTTLQGQYSVVLQKALDYVYNHLNEKINIDDVADAALVSKRQLFRLFKQEMHTTPAAFIMQKKLESAKNMLRYTELSYIEIANNLSFASHSHFIAVFQNQEGITPKKYREQYYRKHFSSR